MRGALIFSLALAPPGDSWFGGDKVKHFLVSAFTQSVAFATLQAAGADRAPALVGATAATISVGIGKELVDRRTGGRASGRDLVWDLAGAGAATVVLMNTEPRR
ncbi:MAG TPA: hypothetical protein VGE02_10120 [Gemmatimonadales bacterium]